MLGKATYMMTAQRDYWMAVAKRVKFDSLPIQPARGNILSCDGQLMVSSLPEYKLFIDFQAMHDSKTDTLWPKKRRFYSRRSERHLPGDARGEV